MQITALKSLQYANQRHDVGDTFDASDRDARILIAIGKASKAKRRSRKTEAETESTKGADYVRRDMKAN